MFKNYLNITFRNIMKNKLISFINIAGLTIGITFFLLLFSYVWNELTYDKFHENTDNIYTLILEHKSITEAALTPEMVKSIGKQYPEVRNYSKVQKELISIEYNNKTDKEIVHFADPEFMDIFTFPLKQGNYKQTPNQLNNIVISEEIAKRILGGEQPIGKTVTLYFGSIKEIFNIAGILKKYPKNSSIKPDIIIPFENIYKIYPGGKDLRLRPVTFYRLKNNINLAELENKVTDDAIKNGKIKNSRFVFSKFANTHFETVTFPSSVISNTSKPVYSYILAALALGILILACFNYMNLSIGNFSTRFREIGVRKVVGAEKKGIIFQFLIESAVITLISFMLGLILTEALIPLFNRLSGKILNLEYLLTWKNMGVIILLLAGTTLATGCYPAVVLSKVNAVDIIKGKTIFGGKKRITRLLIVSQFCLAILLVSGTLLIRKQINYIQSKDLGFNPKNVVMVKTYADLLNNRTVDGGGVAQSFKESLSSYPQIESIAGVYGESAGTLLDDGISYYPYVKDGEDVNVLRLYEDLNYISTINATVLDGRCLSEKIPSDRENAAVVNESFIKAFKVKNPVGKNLSEVSEFKYKGARGWGNLDAKIVGIVKDFHVGSFYHKIKPIIISYGDGWMYTHLAIRIHSSNIPQSIELLKQAWKKTGITHPFTYKFLDEVIADEYANEKRWNEIFGYTSFFAIVIAGMGLLGLSALSVARRTKEIGIRKVLGAEIKSLFLLLTKEFVLLVGVACSVTWPLAYYFGNQWLNDYAYHTTLGLDVLFLSLLITLFIAFTAVSYFTIKAALVNPVESLRAE